MILCQGLINNSFLRLAYRYWTGQRVANQHKIVLKYLENLGCGYSSTLV